MNEMMDTSEKTEVPDSPATETVEPSLEPEKVTEVGSLMGF